LATTVPARRIDYLTGESLARRQGQRTVFARDLLNTLRRRELDQVAAKLSGEIALAHRPLVEGEHVSGVYRQRVMLASRWFAMIDNGLGFQRAVATSAGTARRQADLKSRAFQRSDRMES
jgi:hypothetical protein